MRFIDACLGRPVDTTPVWVMRQAGRYLPEYRALRERADFLTLCKSPALAAEATLQPMRRFDLDAAIVFSDILIPVEAMGVPVAFMPEPRLSAPVRDTAGVSALRTPDPWIETGFVPEAIRLVRAALEPDRALIGFAGAPFTLVCYMVEGGGSHDFAATRAMMYREPVLFADLLARVADAIAPYLVAQVEAGADAVQLFDTWAGTLPPAEFRRFALPAARSVIERARAAGAPVIYFVNGCAGLLRDLPASGADCLGIDYRVDLSTAISALPSGARVQGNLDPFVLLGSEEVVRARTAEIVEAGRAAAGHVFNLGHGILQQTPVENMAALVDQVHKAGRRAK